MLERVRNLIKADRKKSRVSQEQETTPKRTKRTVDHILRRYPITVNRYDTTDDAETLQQHLKAISDEMKKVKPRDRVLLPLMKTTFTVRWLFVTKDASNVADILENYPALKLPIIVSYKNCYLVY